MPLRVQVEPREPSTRYLNAASREPLLQLRKAVSATQAKVMISIMTNMLKMSPVSTRPSTEPESIRYRV